MAAAVDTVGAPEAPLDARTIDAALIDASPIPGASPFDDLAGLPLVLRTVLTLQKEGVATIVIAAAGADAVGIERLIQDRRVRAAVRVEARGWRSVLASMEAPAIVAMHHVVVDPKVYRALRSARLEGARRLFATSDGERLGPFAALPASESDDVAAGKGDATIDVPSAWSAQVASADGRREAFRHLFEACRKPVDGIVSRSLNRHISLFVSKRIVGIPITPNAITLLTFGIAICAALSAARGGYAWMLVGAFLFQWASILDGVDGELARVRFQHSKSGQWLDTVCDDASNVLFYTGVAVGSLSLPLGRILAVCGAVGVVGTVLTCAQYYAELIRLGSGDFYAIEWEHDRDMPSGLTGFVVTFFKYATKKDFFILMFLAFALVGVLPYVLPVVAVGALVTVGAATHRNVSRLRRSRVG